MHSQREWLALKSFQGRVVWVQENGKECEGRAAEPTHKNPVSLQRSWKSFLGPFWFLLASGFFLFPRGIKTQLSCGQPWSASSCFLPFCAVCLFPCSLSLSWKFCTQWLILSQNSVWLRTWILEAHKSEVTKKGCTDLNCFSQGYHCLAETTRTAIWGGKGFHLKVSLKEASTGTQQGRNLAGEAAAEATEGCCLLICSSWLAQPASF